MAAEALEIMNSRNKNNNECKLSPVRSIRNNYFLRVISSVCWYYHNLSMLVHHLLSYVVIYIGL